MLAIVLILVFMVNTMMGVTNTPVFLETEPENRINYLIIVHRGLTKLVSPPVPMSMRIWH